MYQSPSFLVRWIEIVPLHVSEIIARPRGITKLGVGSKGVRWKKYTHQTALDRI